MAFRKFENSRISVRSLIGLINYGAAIVLKRPTVRMSLIIVIILSSCTNNVKYAKRPPQFNIDIAILYSTIRSMSGCKKIEIDGRRMQYLDSLPQTLLHVELTGIKKERISNGKDYELAKNIALEIKSHLLDKTQYTLYQIWIPVTTQYWLGSSTKTYISNILNDSLKTGN